MGPWGFWMCWWRYCGSSCSGPFINSQISETLDSKQIAPAQSLPVPGTTEGWCLCSWNSWRTGETTSAYHWSWTKTIVSHSPITCLGEEIRSHQARAEGH